MRIGKALAAVATFGLLTAPLQAATTGQQRIGSNVEGENLAGGGSGVILIVGLLAAIGALIVVAADDENTDFPASP